MKNNNSRAFIAVSLYILGILLGFTLALIAAWADVESSFYGFDRRAGASLSGLSCPILMTRGENGVVTLTVSNTTNRTLSPSVRTDSSSPLLPVSTLQSFDLAPNESKTLTWTIGPENIDLGNFIFFKALVYAAYPLPDAETTCGVFIVDLPGKGQMILMTNLLISLAAIGSGLLILNKISIPGGQLFLAIRPMAFLAGVTLIAIVTSFLGLWIFAVGALVIALLTSVVTIDYILIKVR